MVKINFAAVTEPNFSAREAGEYECTLIKHEVKAASVNSGQPTVQLQFSENDSPNRLIFKTYSLQPKALWSLKRDLIRIGADVEEMNNEETDLDELIESLYGNMCTVVMDEPRQATNSDGDKLYVDPADPKSTTTVPNDNPKMWESFKEIKDPQKL